MMPKSLHWYDHLSVNIFWLGLNVRNNAVGSLFMPYFVDMYVRAEIKNTALGALTLAGLVVAMLVQPAAGLLSDRSTSRFGRRRPFIFSGVLLDLIFLAAVYFSWNYASLLIAIILLQVSSNISHGPLQGLIPDLVPEEQRGISSAVKSIFELIPLILVGFTIAALVGKGRLDLAFLATAGLLLWMMVMAMFLVREQPLREKPTAPFGPPMLRVLGMLAGIFAGGLAGVLGGALVGAIAGLAAWLISGPQAAWGIGVSFGVLTAMTVAIILGVMAGARATLGPKAPGEDPAERRSFIWWVINRLFFLAAITSIQRFAPYFLMFAFHLDRDAATAMTGNLMAMVGIFTLLTALPGGYLSDRFGHKRVIGISGLAAASGCLLLLITIWAPNLTLIYVVGAILGLSTGLFTTANWALGTKLVPPNEAGRYLGVSNLAGAGAGMIGAGIGGPTIDILNQVYSGLGYFVLFACFVVLFLLSSASLRQVRSIRGQSGSISPLAVQPE